MDWKRIAPWNWFKKVEPPARATRVPARFHSSSNFFSEFRAEMEQLFEEAFGDAFSRERTVPALAGPSAVVLRPSIDFSEGKNAYEIHAEFPGVGSEDISIEVEGHTLVIRAEKHQETDETIEGYHCVGSKHDAMQRVLSLPDDADSEAVAAEFKNGVLKIGIPRRTKRASNPSRIEIG